MRVCVRKLNIHISLQYKADPRAMSRIMPSREIHLARTIRPRSRNSRDSPRIVVGYGLVTPSPDQRWIFRRREDDSASPSLVLSALAVIHKQRAVITARTGSPGGYLLPFLSWE